MTIMKLAVALFLSLLVTPAISAEFGDHCTAGLSEGTMMQTDCSIKSEYKDKTYCFSNDAARMSFMADPEKTIAKASKVYAENIEVEREKISQEEALRIIGQADCDLSNKDIGYHDFKGMDLRHCKMVNTSFFGAYLIGANLSGANMQRAYLNLARLENANLSGADLTDATIFQAIFDKTNFKGANLTNARLIGTLGAVDISDANLRNGRLGLDIGNQPMGQMRLDAIGGNFANSDFSGADINRSNLIFSNLTNANLSNTNLFRADLSRADLTGADLTGADLGEAVLDGTILKDVKGLETVKGMETTVGKCKGCK